MLRVAALRNPHPLPMTGQMALRLTETHAASTARGDEPSATPTTLSLLTDAHAATVAGLVGQSTRALAGEDLTSYGALFAQARELPDQRRYEACKLLLEQGLAISAKREGRALLELLVTLAGAVVELLEAAPAEPILLNYAGVIFYELWSLDAARALFIATRRLDPELPHLASNIDSTRARKRAQSQQPRERRGAFLHPDLPELSRRAVRAASRAQPAVGLRMSLCMIVKDEEEMLGRCLAAAAPAVDEIIVVDTGSSDRTVEIAHEYGALVIEREWTGSFSDARNASFDAATGDWILYLDADEVLISDDVTKLRALRGQTWREAFLLQETNYLGTEEAGSAMVHSTLRVFRNRPEYRFSGRLHEQIVHTLPMHLPERISQSPVRIDHFGYLFSIRQAKDKSRRNLDLLLKQRSDGRTLSAFDHFNLGSEYLALLDFAAAAAEFERAWSLARTGDVARRSFISTLASRLVSSLRYSGRSDQAFVRATDALALFPDFTDLVYNQALACVALGRDAEASALFERCIEMGPPPSRYTSILGSGTFLPRISLAEQLLDQGDPDAALAHLRWCASNHPNYFGIYRPYTRALLAVGHSGAETLSEIDAVLGDGVTSMTRFMTATALVEGGEFECAVAQLRIVLEKRPHNPQATELLLETLLMTQDFVAFEQVLGTLADTGLSERERHERLAQMYLRHGFLRSAGREWMAVVDQAPDAAALRGLAEVARRNGQPEAAHTFSVEALKFSFT